MGKTLTASAVEASKWNSLGFLSRGAASIAVGIVLARLLGPKPFGQVGVAAILYSFGNLLADAGFSSAVVQKPDLEDRQIQFAFTMQVLFGFVLTAVVFSIAPLVGQTVHDPAVTNVVRAVSPIFLLQSLGQTATGLLKRTMRFRVIQTAQVCSYLLGYSVVGIALACAGFGVWSLVAAQLCQPLLYSALVYFQVRHRIYPLLERSGLPLLKFGAQVTGANIINWTISNLDNILVGRAFGSTGLGLYGRAFNLANVPVEGFVGTCQQVLFASCSRVDRDFSRMRRAYLAVIGAVALVTMPTFWSLALCARPVIVGLYGPRWVEAAPLFTAFAIAMPLFALMAIAGPVLAAANQVRREIRTQAASLLFAAVCFVAASTVSLAAVAWAVPVVYAFRFWCATRPTLQLLNIRWVEVGQAVGGPVLASAFTASFVYGTARFQPFPVPPSLLVVELAFVGLVSFLVILYLGSSRIVPMALVSTLMRDSSLLPKWVARRLQVTRMQTEMGVIPAVQSET